MSNWDQLYDLEPLLHTPPTNSSTKQHSYFASKPSRHYDSDVSSVSSVEGVDDFDSPTWWDILDHEQEAIQRYKKFLRGQLHQGQGCEQRQKAEPEVAMTRIEAKSRPLSAKKTISLPKRCKDKSSSHTHIVEVMQDSHDLAGPVEFCFWSMNGQPCQCGKC
ncbi:hypothetical protein D6C85_08079 [Aureobasidium pullulans]|uniref:Uncharacterized protein n=1 Tax=Aureobasidium pullulans TaxID=5580 RepID=A0A4S9WM44_AURPU|nr:hypothetical protein D6C85_08079 [Aureobasidium pullulans]